MKLAALTAAGLALAAMLPSQSMAQIELNRLGTYRSGIFAAGGAEIPAFDPLTHRAFVVNALSRTVDVLDLSDPAQPTLLTTLDVSALGAAANSVDVSKGIVAVAIEAVDKQAPGSVALFDSHSLELVHVVTVGALPDMLRFTHNGKYLLVANEGEPNGTYTNDPEGSVSVIEMKGRREPVVRTAGFAQFNDQAAELRQRGIRIFGPNATPAQDFEPEYITVSGHTAYATLQENNAIAVIDIASATVTELLPLGSKDHSLPGNELDASDRDGGTINIRSWPVRGLYLPDGIASYKHRGHTYLVTANEGDARDYAAFAEEQRIASATLDPQAFPDGAMLKLPANLGRLNRTTTLGNPDGDGDVDALYVLGSRSFSIWNARGEQVFDSGNDFESLTANLFPTAFNVSNDDNTLDSRSDNKGPEPEGIALGEIGGRTYAFIGLERIGGIMVYDVTDPREVQFLQYVNNRDFTQPLNSAAAGDLGPEGLVFVQDHQSPTGKPILIVGNEISGTTTIYQIDCLED